MIGKPLGKANRRQVRKIAKAVNKEGRRTAQDFASMFSGQMSGGQAMVLVGGSKPARGKRAMRTGRRLVWRYRRQLAPILGIVLTWLAGAVIAGRPDATRSVLVIAPIAAGLLWWAGAGGCTWTGSPSACTPSYPSWQPLGGSRSPPGTALGDRCPRCCGSVGWRWRFRGGGITASGACRWSRTARWSRSSTSGSARRVMPCRARS
ncbi:hypothetical protein [Fodinicola feengrottensis]|uniref:hypothetical protein n=1 Tax=Fodinicola feengrottensis TaxID=435914 RepID=UPI002442AD64|nr:hypothetical protein [Fodinicola feengrottensis]